MTRRTRGTLFFSLVFLFFITIGVTFFYSLGWRYDFKNWQVTEPGIFYFKIWPKSAEIKLDGKLRAKTDFIFPSAQVENLVPGFYSVEISKDGYYSWTKNLEIKQREATEVKNVTLIPKNPALSTISEKTDAFYLAPSNKKALIIEDSDTGWNLENVELINNAKIQIASDADFLSLYNTSFAKKTGKKTVAEIKEVKFAKDSKRALLKIDFTAPITGKKTGKETGFFELELWRSPVTVAILDYLPLGTEKIEFNPTEYRKLLAFIYHPEKSSFMTYDAIEIDSEDKTISDVLRKNIITFAVSDADIFYLDENGYIYKTNFSFTSGDKLNNEPLTIIAGKSYDLYYFQNNFSGSLFLMEGSTLFSFDKENQSLSKICETVKEIKISQDNKKIAIISNNEIKVLFLEKKFDQPIKDKGDKVFITRLSDEVKDVNWYTDYYLIFVVGDKIKISEIDERDNINVVDLAKFESPEIYWNQTEKKLYVLSKGNFLVSDKIAP